MCVIVAITKYDSKDKAVVFWLDLEYGSLDYIEPSERL